MIYGHNTRIYQCQHSRGIFPCTVSLFCKTAKEIIIIYLIILCAKYLFHLQLFRTIDNTVLYKHYMYIMNQTHGDTYLFITITIQKTK